MVKQTKASDLSESAVVERAKSLGNRWMGAVLLQHDRIRKPRPQDKAFHPFRSDLFNAADVHFLVIALSRLRKIATTLVHAPQVWDSVDTAIKDFDAKIPWLKRLRDVFEHLEDYAVDSNLRKTTTSRRELQVWSADENGMKWLGYDIDWNKATLAAADLYAALKNVYDHYPRKENSLINNPPEGASC